MKIEIASNEVVKIHSEEEYKLIFENTRAARSMSFEEWKRDYKMPEFPVYLQGINSVTRGYSIGYITTLKGYERILTLKDFK